MHPLSPSSPRRGVQWRCALLTRDASCRGAKLQLKTHPHRRVESTNPGTRRPATLEIRNRGSRCLVGARGQQTAASLDAVHTTRPRPACRRPRHSAGSLWVGGRPMQRGDPPRCTTTELGKWTYTNPALLGRVGRPICASLLPRAMFGRRTLALYTVYAIDASRGPFVLPETPTRRSAGGASGAAGAVSRDAGN